MRPIATFAGVAGAGVPVAAVDADVEVEVVYALWSGIDPFSVPRTRAVPHSTLQGRLLSILFIFGTRPFQSFKEIQMTGTTGP